MSRGRTTWFWTPARVATLRAGYAAGMAADEIAALVGNERRRRGIPTPPRQLSQLRSAQLLGAELVGMVEQLGSYSAVGRARGTSLVAARKEVLRYLGRVADEARASSWAKL